MTLSIDKNNKIGEIIFILLSLYLFFFSPVSFISNILSILLCIGVLLRVNRTADGQKRRYEIYIRKTKFKFAKWYDAVLFIIVNIYLTMAFFGYDLFLDNTAYPGRLTILATFGLGFIWSSFVLQSGLDAITYLSGLKKNLNKPAKDGYWKKWLILFIITFSVFLLWQIAYNPIVVSVDSWGYLSGWRNNRYIMNRSPIYALMVNAICSIAPSKPEVLWIAVTQNLTFSTLIAAILMWFHKKGIRFRYIAIIAVILPLIPSLGLFTINILSDFPCGVSMLWLTYAIIRIIDEVIVNNTATIRQRISLFVQIGLSLIFVALIRQNTLIVYIAMASALFVLSIMKKQLGLSITIVLSAAFVLLARLPGYNMLDVKETESMYSHRYVAGIHDMQATYYNEGNLSEQTYSILNEYINEFDDKERRNFTPDWVHYEAYNRGETHLFSTGDFIHMYADTFIRNPSEMLRSMLWRVRSYWVIDTKGDINFVNRTTIFDHDNDGIWHEKYAESSPKLGVYRNPNILTGIMDEYINLMSRNLPATFIWRFGVWTALMVASALALVQQRRFILLIAFLPVVVFLAGLCLTNGWTDYRLGLPVFYIGMFLPPAMIMLMPSDKMYRKHNKE